MRAAVFRTTALLLLVGLGVAGCGDGDSNAQATAPGCEKVSAPKPRAESLPRPRQSVRPGEKLTAVVKTSCGTFDVALDTERAPKTTNSFAYLARNGFYDGLDFHRVVTGFVVQGGDPLGDGTGGPGYQVDEKPPANLAYSKGVVAMAKSPVEPPGRSGSQFFIITAAAANLGPDYALLGRVDRGMSVVERIGRLGTPSQAPSQTVLIERVAIERG
jgi:peptidyl-prolyl cis-trans isomerase B (cyclophilin B)